MYAQIYNRYFSSSSRDNCFFNLLLFYVSFIVKIDVNFEANWKNNAIPASFICSANYYMASFIPGTPYYRVAEAPETILNDIYG